MGATTIVAIARSLTLAVLIALGLEQPRFVAARLGT